MDVLILLGALVFLMLVAYRGHSVILFAPLAALGAVALVDVTAVPAMFSGVFMEKMASFVKLYFPVFMLGAVFGKLVEMTGCSRALVGAIVRFAGARHAIPTVVLVCGLLTYGGVSVYVVAFAVYPFAVELFQQARIPKRLMPASIALGAFTFSMDALPGTPQIQNIIPTTFFGTDAWAAPWLGLSGGAMVLLLGLAYLNWRQRRCAARGEGYGVAEEAPPATGLATAGGTPHPALALLPLVTVAVANKLFSVAIPRAMGASSAVQFDGMAKPVLVDTAAVTGVWAVEGALLLGIALLLVFFFRRIRDGFVRGSQAAIAGALLAVMNTAAEYGFGAVIASLPGFVVASRALAAIPNPLLNEAVTVTALAGMTGSASGGLSIALAAMSEQFKANALAAGIPFEVMHRIASMASGGMDTLPHNGAIITLLAITGMTHRASYGDIFAITLIKTLVVLLTIGLFYATGIV